MWKRERGGVMFRAERMISNVHCCISGAVQEKELGCVDRETLALKTGQEWLELIC
jgi:hypothetical protein